MLHSLTSTRGSHRPRSLSRTLAAIMITVAILTRPGPAVWRSICLRTAASGVADALIEALLLVTRTSFESPPACGCHGAAEHKAPMGSHAHVRNAMSQTMRQGRMRYAGRDVLGHGARPRSAVAE